jgi:transcriptional regulator with XRE-family HTH domain
VTAADADDRDLRSALGKAIRLRRVELDLSRADLAREADVSYTYVSEIENGTKQASSKTMWRIARALGLEPHELMAMAAHWESRPPGAPTPAASSASESASPIEALTVERFLRVPEPAGDPTPRPRWFHAGRAADDRPDRASPAVPESGPPELVEVLDRVAAALDGVADERAELALMLTLDERRTRRIVREELGRRTDDGPRR